MSEQVGRDYDRIGHEGGWVPIQDERRFELHGEDRLSWLQGQVTQDLRNLADGPSLGFCMCSPTGQIQVVGDIWSHEDHLLLVIPSVCADALAQRVDQMVIMEDVTLVENESIEGFRFYGPAAPPQHGLLEGPSMKGWQTWDLWCSPSESPLIANDALIAHAVHIARLEAGIPSFGIDMTPRTLPPEMGPAFMARNVSLTKGCYTGQEVLMRIHSRGHTNFTWVGLLSPEPLEAGSTVAGGVITSSVISPRLGPIAAARIKNELAMDGIRVTVGGVEAEVRLMPLVR